jgi:hypothetical protein
MPKDTEEGVGSDCFPGKVQDPLRLLGRESLGDNEKRRRDGKGQRKTGGN